MKSSSHKIYLPGNVRKEMSNGRPEKDVSNEQGVQRSLGELQFDNKQGVLPVHGTFGDLQFNKQGVHPVRIPFGDLPFDNKQGIHHVQKTFEDFQSEDVSGAGENTRDTAQKVSVLGTACSAVLLIVLCFFISVSIVLLVNCVNKSICPVHGHRSLRKTVIASAIVLAICLIAALYVIFKLIQSVRICFKK
ncbi:unnamed protein product [Cuscuta epithymum]|uniref:Uncharacterized protein n=1 Tax=Cuscuta epithymum TaxID=186058 RepID=A0AAV0CGL1_9ASTE|nr:unnamed protein product [Cuscuta epithymum]